MKNQIQPFPEVARFPGEPKLEGVPHLRRESIFSEPGIIEALELVNETHELNSNQRRPMVDRAIAKIAFKLELAEELLTGLNSLTDPQTLSNPAKRLHASFLSHVITEKIPGPCTENTSDTTTIPNYEPYRATGEWSLGLRDAPAEKAPLEKVNKDKYIYYTVSKFVSRNNTDDPAVFEAGAKIFNRYYDPEATTESSLIMLDKVLHAIDFAKIKASSRHHTTEVSNVIILGATASLASHLGLGEDTMNTLKNAIEESGKSPKTSWIHTKYRVLECMLDQRRELADYITKQARISSVLEKTGALRNAQELSELSDRAMEKLYEFRKYGIKPAYFRDGILHCAQDSWIIDEPDSFTADMGYRFFNPYMASITLAHGTEISDIKGEQVPLVNEGRGKLYGRKMDYGSHFILGMLPDGELAIHLSAGAIPLRREFAAQGQEHLYELFKLSQINRLIDLVVPSDLIAQAPIKQRKGFLGRLQDANTLASIPKIVLPRLKFITEKSKLIEQELEKELAEAQEKTKQSIRDHEVVGHVRILPPGYKASQTARLEAARYGIYLEDNETWVKKHNRGDKEKGTIRSHQANRLSIN